MAEEYKPKYFREIENQLEAATDNNKMEEDDDGYDLYLSEPEVKKPRKPDESIYNYVERVILEKQLEKSQKQWEKSQKKVANKNTGK